MVKLLGVAGSPLLLTNVSLKTIDSSVMNLLFRHRMEFETDKVFICRS